MKDTFLTAKLKADYTFTYDQKNKMKFHNNHKPNSFRDIIFLRVYTKSPEI